MNWRLSDEEPLPDEDEYWLRPEIRQNTRCTIFFSYTSNQVSCGQREIIRYLAQHKLVRPAPLRSRPRSIASSPLEVVLKRISSSAWLLSTSVTSASREEVFDRPAGGHSATIDLRLKGINRTGNLLVPNKNYCLFEDFMMPILDQCLKEQKEQVWLFL